MKRLLAAVFSVCLSICPWIAHSQTKTLRIVVPFAVGGASDTYTRLIAQKITEQTGKTIVVENRTGAGGRIAFEFAARAPADGSTAVLIDATYAMLPGLFSKLPWDVETDLVPAAMIAQTPFVMLVQSDSKISSLTDLLAQARANPGKLNYGSAGVGSTNHIVTERFKADAAIQLTHIPYRGMSEATVALQSGSIDLVIAASPTAMGPIKSGKLRALAVTTATPSVSLPGIPTAAAAGVPDFVTTNWFGFAFPKGTAVETIHALRDDVARALTAQDVRDKLAAQGAEPAALGTEAFARFVRDDTRRWTETIRRGGIKPE